MLTIVNSYIDKAGPKWRHEVLCDCGAVKRVRGASLVSGDTTSCGCYQRDRSTTHGKTGSREYVAWCAMLTRGRNKNQSGYKNYGGRGISISHDWLDFAAFYKDMGDKPAPNYSIERVDNDKGYSKDNCVWADRASQAINQRIRGDNKTGCKGVYYRKDVGKYSASIQRDKKRINLGLYESLDDAVSARKLAEKKQGEQYV